MATYPGGSNTFIPSWEASGKLQVEFSRNPKSFPVNKYVHQRTTTKETGYYLKIDAEQAARVVNLADNLWPDGAAGSRPGGQTNDGLEKFSWLPFTCERRKFDYPIGYLAAQQADFDVVALHGRVNAQTAMTVRTMIAMELLTATANWGSNTSSVTGLSTGVWTDSSVDNRYILKTINKVKIAINQATLGVVRPEHIRMVINPDLAHVVREAPEITDFVKQQASSGKLMQGTEFFDTWGIPERLYGVKVVVEDCVKNVARKGATASISYACPGNVAIFTANSSDVDGETVLKPESGDGVPIFDTITNFLFEDMTVEARDNPNDRRIEARIVDHYGMKLTAPATGYLVTGVV